MLDKIWEDLLDKYKENKINISFEPEYKTPEFNKFSKDRFGSSTTFESETQNFQPKTNREQVGEDLKLQWSEMMKEFEQSTKKQVSNSSVGTHEHLKETG